jgi:hypothetical protein
MTKGIEKLDRHYDELYQVLKSIAMDKEIDIDDRINACRLMWKMTEHALNEFIKTARASS